MKPIQSKAKKLIIYFLVCAFLFVPIATADMTPISSADSKTTSLEKQIKDKKAAITANTNMRKDLENKIASLKSQQADALRDKRLYDSLVTSIEAGIKEHEELIEYYKELIKQTETDIVNAQAEYEQSFDLFLGMIKFSYEESKTNYLSLLLKSENFTEFLSRVDVVSNLIEYNKSVIVDLQYSKENLEAAK